MGSLARALPRAGPNPDARRRFPQRRGRRAGHWWTPRTPYPTPRRENGLRLDIVMPAHNEEDRIGRTLSVYRDVCADPEIRFLVAMDDCRDRTADVVQA